MIISNKEFKVIRLNSANWMNGEFIEIAEAVAIEIAENIPSSFYDKNISINDNIEENAIFEILMFKQAKARGYETTNKETEKLIIQDIKRRISI